MLSVVHGPTTTLSVEPQGILVKLHSGLSRILDKMVKLLPDRAEPNSVSSNVWGLMGPLGSWFQKLVTAKKPSELIPKQEPPKLLTFSDTEAEFNSAICEAAGSLANATTKLELSVRRYGAQAQAGHGYAQSVIPQDQREVTYAKLQLAVLEHTKDKGLNLGEVQLALSEMRQGLYSVDGFLIGGQSVLDLKAQMVAGYKAALMAADKIGCKELLVKTLAENPDYHRAQADYDTTVN